MISTSCRFCEFNIKDENGNQTGCELNMLERFASKDIKSQTKEFDDNRGKGTAQEIETFCMFRRPPGWKEAKKAEEGSFYDIARNELILKTTLVVFIPPKTEFIKVYEFVEYVNEMTKKPDKLIFINYARLSPLLFQRLNALTKIEWQMEFMLNDKDDVNELRNKGNDLASKKVKTPYMITLDLDSNLDKDYIEVIETQLIDDLERFVAVTDEIGKPNFYQTVIYRFVRGNEQENVNTKISWLSEDQKCQYLIKQNSDLYSCPK